MIGGVLPLIRYREIGSEGDLIETVVNSLLLTNYKIHIFYNYYHNLNTNESVSLLFMKNATFKTNTQRTGTHSHDVFVHSESLWIKTCKIERSIAQSVIGKNSPTF